MIKKGLIVVLVFCISLMLGGCPKKAAVKEEPSAKTAAQLAAEREKEAKMEAERKEKEAAQARVREEEARKREEARKQEEARRQEEARKREEARKQEARKQEEFLKSLVEKKTPGTGETYWVSPMLKDIHFDFDRYDIRPGDAEILKENAGLLMKNPNMKIQVEGHCDERGTAEYNLALGERRASSTKKYLLSLGMTESKVATISYGEEKPVDPGQNEDAWAKNRRASFIILSK